MASGVYNIFKSEVMKKSCDLVNDTIKMGLLNNSHSFAASSVTNDSWGDISANELAASGNYSTGGGTLTTKAVTVDDADNEGVFDADNEVWSTATFTAYHGVIYNDTMTSPADMLISSHDFGMAVSATGADFTVTFAAEGIINLT